MLVAICFQLNNAIDATNYFYWRNKTFTSIFEKRMTKATTIKDALKRWEEANQQAAAEATVIELQFQWPPIEKMDNHLSALVNCE